MRLIVETAAFVCKKVANVKWPVSAILAPILWSRVAHFADQTTSGSCRRAVRNGLSKTSRVGVSLAL